MKRSWLYVIFLAGLLSLSWFILANCGGLIPAGENITNATKGWQLVGNIQPSLPSYEAQTIFLWVYQGTPIIAYADEKTSFNIGGGGSGMEGVVRVIKYNGTSWESIGDPPLKPTPNLSFFVYAGIPYLGFRDDNNYGSGKNEIVGYASVFKYNGSSWESVGQPAFSAGGILYPSLSVSNGIPYIAYSDLAHESRVTVMKFNGSSWESVGQPGFSPCSGEQYISLCVFNGTPYVAFNDNTFPGSHGFTGKISVMKFNGAAWEYVGTPGFSADAVRDIDLKIYNGIPYVAYGDYSFSEPFIGSTESIAKATVMKFNGSSWESVGPPGFSAGDSHYCSLFISNGNPYIAFRDNSIPFGLGAASVMRFNGTGWEYVGGQGFTTMHAVGYTSLYIDNGIPYLAYRDIDNNNSLTLMKYIE